MFLREQESQLLWSFRNKPLLILHGSFSAAWCVYWKTAAASLTPAVPVSNIFQSLPISFVFPGKFLSPSPCSVDVSLQNLCVEIYRPLSAWLSNQWNLWPYVCQAQTDLPLHGLHGPPQRHQAACVCCFRNRMTEMKQKPGKTAFSVNERKAGYSETIVKNYK